MRPVAILGLIAAVSILLPIVGVLVLIGFDIWLMRYLYRRSRRTGLRL